MRLIRGINNLKKRLKKPVLTIGTFDGMHLAHQKIVKAVVQQAKIIKGTSMVLTFTPHPLRIVSKSSATPLITSLEHRISLFKQLKVDVCSLLDFNKVFSRVSGKNFVKHILIDTIGVNYVIIGEGFRFGKNRTGSFSLLKGLSKKYGFKVKRIKTIKINGQIISSTRIRSLIQKGKINQANKFLGRKFSIYGRVKKGSCRGRILGYPTANIDPQQEIVPAYGVYAVIVKFNSCLFPGILNIGARPTFHVLEKSPVIEVHIFNFKKKIYGKKLEVFFVQRIRAEKKFASHKDLLVQIKKDELKTKKILKGQRFPSTSI